MRRGDSELCVCWKSITALHLGTSGLGRASAAPYQLVLPLRVCVYLLLCVCDVSFPSVSGSSDSQQKAEAVTVAPAECRELGQGHGCFSWLRDGLIIQMGSINPVRI